MPASFPTPVAQIALRDDRVPPIHRLRLVADQRHRHRAGYARRVRGFAPPEVVGVTGIPFQFPRCWSCLGQEEFERRVCPRRALV